jgi:hypothetical protein
MSREAALFINNWPHILPHPKRHGQSDIVADQANGGREATTSGVAESQEARGLFWNPISAMYTRDGRL